MCTKFKALASSTWTELTAQMVPHYLKQVVRCGSLEQILASRDYYPYMSMWHLE